MVHLFKTNINIYTYICHAFFQDKYIGWLNACMSCGAKQYTATMHLSCDKEWHPSNVICRFHIVFHVVQWPCNLIRYLAFFLINYSQLILVSNAYVSLNWLMKPYKVIEVHTKSRSCLCYMSVTYIYICYVWKLSGN